MRQYRRKRKGPCQIVCNREAHAFRLEDVRLLDGPFKHAETRDAEYLLRLDADRLLSGFRKEAGLAPKAEVYGGWESMTIAGHSLGHYLVCLRVDVCLDRRCSLS